MTAARTKVAIVTGAARPWGLGRATALGLARGGMDVVIADIRDDWAREAVGTIQKETGRKVLYARTDVSQRAQVKAMVDLTLRELGRIDVLANVAGVVEMHTAEQFTDEAFDHMINVNLRGTMLTCQAVLPAMRRQGGGRIVNVSSLSAYRAMVGIGIYGASKAGVIMYGKCLALEVSKDNIIVTTVAPSAFVTNMGQETGPTAEDWERGARGVPIGRAQTPEEVAEVIIFAATTGSPALNGQVLHANAGIGML